MPVVRHRHRVAHADGRHTGQLPQIVEQAADELDARAGVGVARRRQHHLARHDLLGTEAGIDVPQLPKALDKQASGHEQCHRQAHLTDHQRLLHANAADALTRSALGQPLFHPAADHSHGRNDAGENRGQRGDRRCEEQRPQVERCFADARNRRRSQLHDQLDQHNRQHDPGHSSDESQPLVSASTCSANRSRLAPSAVRIANSRRRPTPRATSRFATFAHASSRTKPTAAASSVIDRSAAAVTQPVKRNRTRAPLAIIGVLTANFQGNTFDVGVGGLYRDAPAEPGNDGEVMRVALTAREISRERQPQLGAIGRRLAAKHHRRRRERTAPA